MATLIGKDYTTYPKVGHPEGPTDYGVEGASVGQGQISDLRDTVYVLISAMLLTNGRLDEVAERMFGQEPQAGPLRTPPTVPLCGQLDALTRALQELEYLVSCNSVLADRLSRL